jgi:hypothetical protein
MKNQPKIRVWITKSWKFRALVDPPDPCQPKYEVTVGEEMWKKGKGRPWQGEILEKCRRLREHLLKFTLDEAV